MMILTTFTLDKGLAKSFLREPISQVTFLMTGAGAGVRRRRSLRAGSFQDYKDLALASGGQAIQVTKTQLPQATDVILDTSTSALVRLAYKNSTKCGLSKSSTGSILLLLSCSVR